jgi:uncharacterized protein DUF4242
MPKYVIEREVPGAGRLTAEELEDISKKSRGVLERLSPRIEWVQSFVTDDKIYCLYISPNAELLVEHARQAEFPVNRISEVRSVIDPATAE